MNIGIDISQIAYTGTGVSRFTRGLVIEILRHSTDHTWTFFYSSLRKKIDPFIVRSIQSSGYKLISLPIPPTILSYMWNTLHIIPIETFTGPLDWFITSDWTEPPAHAKKATIIHDLTIYKYPNTVHSHIMSTQMKRLHHVSQESRLIISDSEATTKDIQIFLSHMQGKIQTIYPGVTISKPATAIIEKARQTFSITKPFVFTVGKTEPRKNIPRLIQAFNSVNNGSFELIVAGPNGWDDRIALQDLSHVRLIGMVSEAELHSLYSLCTFFAYPSLWEGFGYPVVEALLHRKAVLTSQTSSLIEVAKQGALMCDPESVQSIANALNTLMNDSAKRDELANAGKSFAEQFTWQQYYQRLMNELT